MTNQPIVRQILPGVNATEQVMSPQEKDMLAALEQLEKIREQASRKEQAQLFDLNSRQNTAEPDEAFKVPLSNGHTVVMAKPQGSVTVAAIRMLGQDAKNELLLGMAIAAMYIYKIDDKEVRPPETAKELEALNDLLGDDGLQKCILVMGKKFPSDQGGGLSLEDVAIVKK